MTTEHLPFSGGGLQRVAHERADSAALWNDDSAGCLLFLDGQVLVQDDGALALLPVADASNLVKEGTRILIGRDSQDRPVFAANAALVVPEQDPHTYTFLNEDLRFDEVPQAAFKDLRAIMTSLTPLEAEIAATARALLAWHQRHGYCANCGAKTELDQAGWQRTCPSCKAVHFPRTDPVAIMLVTKGNACLLGRGPQWPERMYSALAGFVEPGETPEAAVRREVFEEVGVSVGDVRYIESQPWPFPASLMLGYCAKAISDEITVDPNEIEDAVWVSREELLKIFAGQHPKIDPPRKGAIAELLIRKWLAGQID